MNGRAAGSSTVAIFLTLALAGCGQEQPTSMADTGTAPTAAEVAAAEESLRDVFQFVVGTPQQESALHVLEYLDFHEPLQACVAAAGQTYRAPMFIDLSLGRDNAPLPSSVMEFAAVAGSDGMWQPSGAKEISALANAARAFTGGAYDSPPAAYAAALDGCLGTATTSVDRRPTAAKAVYSSLQRAMHDVAEDVDMEERRAAYLTCVASAGFEASEFSDMTILARSGYAPFAVDIDNPAATLAPQGPQWDAAVAKEKAVAKADATCRSEVHAEAMVALAPALRDLTAERRDDLQRAMRAWDALSAEASARLAQSPVRSAVTATLL